MVTFGIDLASAETVRFPRPFLTCVGSCHAAMALREDWRRQMEQCRRDIGFGFVRFHGLLNDDMSVCRETDGRIVYSFNNVDSIFDFLLGIGMKPFVELSFMPGCIASGTRAAFHYRGNVTPPKDYSLWGDLVRSLARHLVERYGAREVTGWYFEVWNEPNLEYFWGGSREEYFALYRKAALAIKEVDRRIPVGGPATARNEWIPEMIEFCEREGAPLDFVSTHHYPTDIALENEQGKGSAAVLRRGILTSMARTARAQAGKYPLHYTEWNSSPSSRDPLHDEPFAAAFIVKTAVEIAPLVQSYSYWAFSDIFEELGFSSTPFHGGFGLLTIHGVPKPSYRAFQLLRMLGSERLAVSSDSPESMLECVATREGNTVTMLLYNHNAAGLPLESERARIDLHAFSPRRLATLYRIDDEHANPARLWRDAGSPEYPDAGLLKKLFAASEMEPENIQPGLVQGGARLEIQVPAHGVAGVKIT
jgi:xylan 1,4-beta-xylosidase